MVDKTFKIDFVTNIDKLLTGTARMLKDFTDTKTTAAKLEKSIEKSAKHIEKMSKDMKDVQKPFEDLFSSLVPFGGKLVEQNRRITEMINNLSKVKEAGGFFNIAGKYIGNMAEKTKQAGRLMIDLLGNGVAKASAIAAGGIEGIGAALGSVTVAAAPLVAALAAVAAVIAVVVAAVFTLKRMWVNNIGGMQTTFLSFIAKLKTAWSKFVVRFDRMLRKISPAIKVLVNIIGVALSGALEIVTGLVDGLFIALEPIFDAIAEIGAAINEAFGSGQDDMRGMMDVAKAIAAVFRGIGTAIAFVIKLMRPFIEMLKLVIKGMGAINSFVHQITGTAASPATAPAAPPIRAGEPLMASNVTNTRSVVVNNNQQVAVHSSGAITPQSAPMIGSVIASSLSTGSKVV